MAVEKNDQDINKIEPKNAKEKIEEVEEDVDESQFIPAYLSSTENEMTDLNNTELNTEFNTTRNANNGGYPLGSARGSARGQNG